MNNINSTIYKHNSKLVKRGGIKCYCCTFWKSRKRTRVKVNRAFRRASKQQRQKLTTQHEEDNL